jgi:hypothetical protein
LSTSSPESAEGSQINPSRSEVWFGRRSFVLASGAVFLVVVRVRWACVVYEK